MRSRVQLPAGPSIIFTILKRVIYKCLKAESFVVNSVSNGVQKLVKGSHATSRTWSNCDRAWLSVLQTVQFSCSNLINSINWNVIEVPFRYLKCCMRWLLNSNLFIYLLPKADPSLLTVNVLSQCGYSHDLGSKCRAEEVPKSAKRTMADLFA